MINLRQLPQFPFYMFLVDDLTFQRIRGKHTNGWDVKVLYFPLICLLLPMPSWPTCPGTQEKNKNRLLSKVLNGQVSLLSSHRTIHTLIAVPFTQKKKRNRNLFTYSLGNKTLSAQNQTLILSFFVYRYAPTFSKSHGKNLNLGDICFTKNST